MKKRIIVLIVLLSLFVLSIFLFVPKKVNLSIAEKTPAIQVAVARMLSNEANWENWWPGEIKTLDGKKVYEYNGKIYQLDGLQYNAIRVKALHGDDADSTVLHFLPGNDDSTNLVWTSSFKEGNNPVARLKNYTRSKKLKSDLSEILDSLKKYTSQVKNLYGYDVRHEKIKIEYLVTVRTNQSKPLTTEQLYKTIGEIKNYIELNGGKIEGDPITSSFLKSDSSYAIWVGVPIVTPIDPSGKFEIKNLLRNGDVLGVEVTGGPATIAAAEKAADQFAKDNRLHEVAVRYQTLLMDRSKQPDTTKWKTKVFYPIG